MGFDQEMGIEEQTGQQQQQHSSEEEEEEEDEPVPVRTQQVRMVVTQYGGGGGESTQTSEASAPAQMRTQSKVAGSQPSGQLAPSMITTTRTTIQAESASAAAEQVRQQQEAAIEAARLRHQEAIEKARAEAARQQQEQQRQAAEQARQQAEQQKQQQLKAQQEAVAKRQAEERAQQVKVQQQATAQQQQQRGQQAQLQQQQQQPVAAPKPAAPAQPAVQQQPKASPQQVAANQKNPAQSPAQQQKPQPAKPAQQPVAQQPKAQPSVPAAAKASAQPAAQQPKAAAQVPAATAATTQQRQPPPVAREPEQLEAPKSVLRHAQFQPRNPKAESHEWPPREEEEADQLAQSQPVPQNKVLGDAAWQVQKRVQVEYQPVQPARLQMPELDYEGEIKKTIVPQPAGFSKVQWNEFPEEEQKEQQSVPRVKAQDWVPENDVEHPVLKTVYQPSRIPPNPQSGRLWPPPGYGEEEQQIELGNAGRVKTMGDEDWKQQQEDQQAMQNGAEDGVGNAPWRRQATGGNVRQASAQWPPPENELQYGYGPGGRLQVQWPPTGQDEQEQKQDDAASLGNSPWGRQIQGTVRNAQWPPPENESEQADFGSGGKLQVQWPPAEGEGDKENTSRRQAFGGNVKTASGQWPPPEHMTAEPVDLGPGGKLQAQWPPQEFEEIEQKQVEILQTHLPTKPHERQWPPPHYLAAQGEQQPSEA